MSQDHPRLYADERGIWREDTPGQPFGITWDEIASVSAYKVNLVTEVWTMVVLDFEYGEWIELCSPWPGFAQVVEAITARLPGISATWFEEIDRLGVGEPVLTVWQRPSPTTSKEGP
jgi:hypothetical protein